MSANVNSVAVGAVLCVDGVDVVQESGGGTYTMSGGGGRHRPVMERVSRVAADHTPDQLYHIQFRPTAPVIQVEMPAKIKRAEGRTGAFHVQPNSTRTVTKDELNLLQKAPGMAKQVVILDIVRPATPPAQSGGPAAAAKPESTAVAPATPPAQPEPAPAVSTPAPVAASPTAPEAKSDGNPFHKK